MSSGTTPEPVSSSTSAATSSASARSPPASSSRTAPFGGRRPAPGSNSPRSRWCSASRAAARVVLGAVVQQLVALGQRLEQLDGRRPPGERGAAGLVGERHADVGVAGERLDRVALERRQVVEPVEEHRPAAPRGRALAQRVERRPREPLGVDRAEPLEPPVVGGVERGELAGVGRRRRPSRARARANRAGLDQRPAELGEQRSRGAGEAGRRGRAGQHVEPRVRDRRAHDALARDRAEHARAHAGGLGDPAHEPRERRDLGAEHDPLGRQLALVVLDVGRRRHDEHRLARQRGPEALEHGAGLGGVRGSGDQREGHDGPTGSRAHQTFTASIPVRDGFLRRL